MMDTLVSAEWLSRHLYDPDLVLLDCTVCTLPDDELGLRNVSGRPDYELGHIPNAGFADLKGDLCDLNSSIEFSLPTAEQFCSVMGELGVGDDSRVVLYDTNYTAWAARVWWMLRWTGFDNAAILDGGMAAWTSEGRPLSTETVNRAAKHLTPTPRPELIADRDEVLASIDDHSVSLIDTMPEEFYRGEMTLYARAGHIPGALNINGLNLLDKSGRFKSTDDLAAMHSGNHNTRIITYCGGGIMASSEAFILSRLGFTNVAVYTASLQEWVTDPANPLVVGDE
ncbi:MAG: sulfurtransferase [Gammaproteobacteria bacterium]|nr:sulfurtransferase [Gammaproteobacteria bacterium]MCW8911373.1 sulfurtransferase [Gammaproteobacteria bacterium]MCW9004104.1 sulfurtransferase [Gammaproteobacteria bacterium]